MSDNEVGIKIRQSSEGNAIDQTIAKMEQLRTRIAEINRMQASYAQKGITGTADLTQERTALQRELSGMEKGQREEQRRAAAEAKAEVRGRKDTEQEINRLHREREAVSRGQRGSGQGWNIAGTVAGAAGVPGGHMLAGGGAALPAMLAVLAGTIMKRTADAEFDRIDTRNAEQGRQVGQFNQARRARNRENPLDREAESNSLLAENQAALEAAKDRRGTFHNSTWSNILTVGGRFGERDGDKAARENEEEIARRQAAMPRLEKDARENQSGIRTDLEARQAGLRYDMEGKRFAEDKLAAMKEYKRVMDATGGPEKGDKALAEKAATDLVRERQRERAGSLAGLINARDGAKDVARVASFAAGLDNPERAGKVFAAALRPVIEQAGSPLRDFERRERR